MTQASYTNKCVVVHRGARDAYQVAVALEEAGMLQSLVTDLYWHHDRRSDLNVIVRHSGLLRRALSARFSPSLPSSQVTQVLLSGFLSHLLDKIPGAPFSLQRLATRWADACIGRRGGSLARTSRSSLLSYSYYGFDAFKSYGRPAILFQAHPHPASVRQILQRELERNPDCAESLKKEWELALPPNEFNRLVSETTLASRFLVASSFTGQTLIENGVHSEDICVIPYGVDLGRFTPGLARSKAAESQDLKLLFVGRINQRKGIKYLLEAIKMVRTGRVHLTVCGRVVDDLSIFKRYATKIDIRPSISSTELIDAYRSADLFVLPSVAEGFGQVLLEALACGLPILSTNRTAAPDLVQDGGAGFVVEAGRADLLAEKLEWALSNRLQLVAMRESATQSAARFTWARFRAQIVTSVKNFQQLANEPDLKRTAQYA